jgi:tetratricopeptide (TPR) repeat protein
MPKTPVRDAQHVVYTDHSIPARPRKPQPAQTIGELVPFGGGNASERDLGLAYAIAGDRRRALPLLQKAVFDAAADAEPLVYLADIYRDNGKADEAIALYERALKLDPMQVMASAGARRHSHGAPRNIPRRSGYGKTR